MAEREPVLVLRYPGEPLAVPCPEHGLQTARYTLDDGRHYLICWPCQLERYGVRRADG